MSHPRILIALDASDCASDIARRGGELARQLGAQPILLHVVRPPEVPPDTRLPADDATAEELTVEEYLRRAADRRLARYAELVGDAPFPPLRTVRFGPPAETIVDEARQCAACLIVMGTRARAGLVRAVFGSVALEVVRTADVPVTTVRSHWTPACAARSCTWCITEPTPEEERVAGEQWG